MGKLLDELMKDINKESKEEIFTKGLNAYNYERIPFTSPRMNYCSFGGIPIGKITEFYGVEHGGKTTSALDVVANYQNIADAKDVIFVDAENTLDPEWAFKLGVDIDELYIIQPKSQSAEDIFMYIENAVRTGECGLWVLDSIGALLSDQAWDKDYDEKTYAGISSSLTRFGAKMVQLNHRTGATGLAINQERDDLNSTYGGKKTPGGHAWRHFCSVRMEFRKGKYVDKHGNEQTKSIENPAGNIVDMIMTKNKTCPPTRRVGRYTINYDIGIDYIKDLVDVAKKYGIVDKHGAWFEVVDTSTGEVLAEKINGQSKVFSLFEEDDDLRTTVEELIEEISQQE